MAAPRRGDLVAHFTALLRDGTLFDSAEIWQRRNLLLVVLPEDTSKEVRRYAAALDDKTDAIVGFTARCVITSQPVADISPAGLVIADRWGEVYFAVSGVSVSNLPNVVEILECLRYIEHECPECQGEVR